MENEDKKIKKCDKCKALFYEKDLQEIEVRHFKGVFRKKYYCPEHRKDYDVESIHNSMSFYDDPTASLNIDYYKKRKDDFGNEYYELIDVV